MDILLIHQPSVEQMNNPEAVAALKELKQQKTARFIGVSTHADQAGVLKSAAETGTYDVVLAGFNVTNAADARPPGGDQGCRGQGRRRRRHEDADRRPRQEPGRAEPDGAC